MSETEHRTATLTAAAARECQVIAELLNFDEMDLVETEQKL